VKVLCEKAHFYDLKQIFPAKTLLFSRTFCRKRSETRIGILDLLFVLVELDRN
jgi:hypothetical protein